MSKENEFKAFEYVIENATQRRCRILRIDGDNVEVEYDDWKKPQFDTVAANTLEPEGGRKAKTKAPKDPVLVESPILSEPIAVAASVVSEAIASPAPAPEIVAEPAAEPIVVPKFSENEIVYHLTRGEGRVVSATIDNVHVKFTTSDDEDEYEDWISPEELTTKPVKAVKSKEKSLLSYALACVKRGWFVFPCKPRSKKPATESGFKDASNDVEQIKKWWAENPQYNPAIALGASNLVVYDFDEIRPFENLPATFTVRTGRLPKDGIEGVQKYFVGSCKTHGHPGGGGEVRSRGAYVLAPGAIHPSGNAYKVISDAPLAPSPEQNEEIAAVAAPAIGTDAQETIAAYVEKAFDEAGVDYQARVAYVPPRC
jgi:hypothetical protein